MFLYFKQSLKNDLDIANLRILIAHLAFQRII